MKTTSLALTLAALVGLAGTATAQPTPGSDTPLGTAVGEGVGRLEAVVEGVLVTGTVSAELEGECARCLEAVRSEIDADLCELFVYDEADGPQGSQDDEDDDTSRLQGDLLDLEPLLRDAVVLALPFQPLCQDDCPGLCVECGARLADDPDHRHEDPIDPRWAALQGLAGGDQQDQRDQ